MPITLPETASRVNFSTAPSCCSNKTEVANWVKTVDLICRVALTAFGAAIAPLFFGVALGVGVFLGTVYAIVRYTQHKPLLEQDDSKPICAQGFMNYLSGMRFPPVVNSVVTAAFIGAHIRHDPQFFVPFVGLFVGIWIGRDGAEMVRDLGGRFFSLFQQQPQPQPRVVTYKCSNCVQH